MLRGRVLVDRLPIVLLAVPTRLCVARRESVVMCRMLWEIWCAHVRGLPGLSIRASRMVASFPAVHATVPPVLHRIVTSASQASRNLSPPLAHFTHHLFDQHPFLRRDGIVAEIRLEVLVESLATLLGTSGL